MIYRFLISFLLVVIIFEQVKPYTKQDSTINKKANQSINSENDLIKFSKKIKTELNLYGIKAARKMTDSIFCIARAKNIKIPYEIYKVNIELLYFEYKIKEALSQYDTAYAIIEKKGNELEILESQNFKGKLLTRAGFFFKAIDLFEKIYDKANKINANSKKADILFNLSEVYRLLSKKEEWVKYLEKAQNDALKYNDTVNLANTSYKLGEVSQSLDSNFALSKTRFFVSLKLYILLKDSIKIEKNYTSIGWNYYLTKDYDSALYYYKKAEIIGLKLKYKTIIANTYGNIGTIYRDIEKYDSANTYYQQAIKYAKMINDWYNLSWIYRDLSQMLQKKGNYKDALDNYILYKSCEDSLWIDNLNENLSKAKFLYETEAKEKELQILNLKLNQQRYYIYGFIVLIVLLILVAILLFRFYQLKSKRRMSEMNQRIAEITQANLRQQMNPHFIFNTLNSIQYYMYQHDKIATNNYLTKFSTLIRKILENSQHPYIPLKDELDAIQLYIELEAFRFKDKFSYQININEEIDTIQFKIPAMLIQPYVENAICHGLMYKQDNGFLKIELSLKEIGLIRCIIEDNGIGRESARQIRDSKNANHISLGTKITESRLLLVNQLYGTTFKVQYIDLKDSEGNAKGTRVELHIPIIYE